MLTVLVQPKRPIPHSGNDFDQIQLAFETVQKRMEIQDCDSSLLRSVLLIKCQDYILKNNNALPKWVKNQLGNKDVLLGYE